jgi:hypothetical protein
MLTRAEWCWLIIASLIVVALSCVPFIYAALAAPNDHTFNGFIVNAQDGNSYLAKMRQGYDGAWLYRLAYTPEEQRGVLIYTYYLLLGHAARITNISLIFLYHLARVFNGIFLFITIYCFTSLLTSNITARRGSFIIASFSSGLALVSLLAGRNDAKNFIPLDLFVPEAYGFYSLLPNPHFALLFGLMMWAIILTLQPPQFRFWIQLILIAITGLAITSLAPYLAPVVGVAVGAGAISVRPFNRDLLIRLFTFFAAMGALLVYYFAALGSDPFVAEWSRQNITLTPPLVDVLLGLGIWLPLAIVGVTRLQRSRPVWSLIVWLIAIAALIYFPYPLQRRFLGGVFVPLSIFSGMGVAWIMGQIESIRVARIAFTIGVAVFGFSTNVLLLLSLFRAPSSPDLYLKNDEVQALHWLSTQVKPADVVLADTRMGGIIPGWTGARVIYGHPMESFDALNRKAEVESFFANGDTRIADRYRVKYIFGGSAPQGWRVVFESGDVKVYGR